MKKSILLALATLASMGAMDAKASTEITSLSQIEELRPAMQIDEEFTFKGEVVAISVQSGMIALSQADNGIPFMVEGNIDADIEFGSVIKEFSFTKIAPAPGSVTDLMISGASIQSTGEVTTVEPVVAKPTDTFSDMLYRLVTFQNATVTADGAYEASPLLVSLPNGSLGYIAYDSIVTPEPATYTTLTCVPALQSWTAPEYVAIECHAVGAPASIETIDATRPDAPDRLYDIYGRPLDSNAHNVICIKIDASGKATKTLLR